MMNLPYSESTNKNFIADLENIPVPRELLKKTTAGAFIGYFFIHPLIMILSYYMSVIFPPDGPSIKTGILPEISRSFSVPMLPWSLAFATFGGLVGYYLAKKRQADAARSSLIVQLEASLSTIRKLSGLLPICASCKRIRDDKGYWNQLETYISEHSEAEFSHGFCPECMKKLYGDVLDGGPDSKKQ